MAIVGTNVPAASWSGFFRTKDGESRPIRLRFAEPVSIEMAMWHAELYRVALGSGLTGTAQLFPTRELPEEGLESCHA
jgi:hypothetical protein